MKKHLIFDFFGTLVFYSKDRTDRDYKDTLSSLQDIGVNLTQDEFLIKWKKSFSHFEQLTSQSLDEYSILEVANHFFQNIRPALCGQHFIEQWVDIYLREWEQGVFEIPRLADLLHDLSIDFSLSILSNTHSQSMVPRILDKYGLSRYFDVVLTSVEAGKRKPHPYIYQTHLERLGTTKENATYIGDSMLEDYRGPSEFGMSTFLIDPQGVHDVPPDTRLQSIFDLTRLRPG